MLFSMALQLTSKKTKGVVLIGTNAMSNEDLKINGKTIDLVTTFEYLGRMLSCEANDTSAESLLYMELSTKSQTF